MSRPPHRRFRAAFWTDKPLKNWEFTLKFIGIVEDYEQTFTPMSFFGGDATRAQMQKWEDSEKQSKVDKLANAMLSPQAICVGLDNGIRAFKQDFPFSYTIHYADPRSKKPAPSVLSLDVGYGYFQSFQQLETFIAVAERISAIADPLWGYIHDVDDSLAIMGRHRFAPRRYAPAAFWGSYFGPAMLARMDMRKLLSFRHHSKKELENGTLYMQMTADPADVYDKNRRKQLRKFARAVGAWRPNRFSKTAGGDLPPRLSDMQPQPRSGAKGGSQ